MFCAVMKNPSCQSSSLSGPFLSVNSFLNNNLEKQLKSTHCKPSDFQARLQKKIVEN
jgi:hypothetical protein